MKKNYTFSLSLVLLLLLPPMTSLAQNRGNLLSSTLLSSKNTSEIDILVNSAIDGVPPFFVGFLIPTNYDVDVYKLTYSTINEKGQPVPASGAIFIPQGYPCPAAMAPYLHGTLTSDLTVPSTLNGEEALIGWALATDGYVTVLPDFIGLGESPGVHPYLHADTQASASIDMMRAARQFCNQNGIALNGQIFLSGYSQGGHAAVATQREIERNHRSEFNLELVVAGSGPYDLSGVQRQFVLDNPTYPSPSFLPFLLLGYQSVYGNLYNNLEDAFAPPFETTVPILLNGTKTVAEIDAELPAVWRDVFQPDFINDIENNFFNPVNRALRLNDLYRWRPRTPLRLYYCTNDELVDLRNSLVAWFNFFIRGAGGKVRALPVGPFTHAACAPAALIVGKLKFNSLRNESCRHIARVGNTGLSPLSPRYESMIKLANETDAPDLKTLLKKHGLHDLIHQLPGEVSNKDTAVSLYPNPASSFVNLSFNAPGEQTSFVTIYDYTGRSVKQLKNIPSGQSIKIDLTGLQPGIYFIVINDNKALTTQLVVE